MIKIQRYIREDQYHWLESTAKRLVKQGKIHGSSRMKDLSRNGAVSEVLRRLIDVGMKNPKLVEFIND